jgi:hypothetical protein
MLRTLPDFVDINEKRYNYYEDPKNEAKVIKGLKFMQKLRPTYLNTIHGANDLINKPKLKMKVPDHRVNIFQEESDSEKPKTAREQARDLKHLKTTEATTKVLPTLTSTVDLDLLPTSDLLQMADHAIRKDSPIIKEVASENTRRRRIEQLAK